MYNITTKLVIRRGFITLWSLMLTICLNAQNIVKGTVLDETNLPLVGATVLVKGQKAGTVTNLDGHFSINAKKGSTIVVSFIGYETKEVRYENQQILSIRMNPDNQTLDEVVVVGYGSMKRSDLTGSVASVASKDIVGFQSSSAMGALSGQVAGVQITQTDGGPGSGFNINIRGVGTMTGDASPLFIVDGFEVDNIDHIAETNIESMEFLKDASSSAIYGARAANGVVMINTKTGKVGKPTINYSGSATYRKITKYLDVLDPYEFVKLQGDINPGYKNTYYQTGNNADGVPYLYQTADDYISVKGLNWQEETFNPTWSQNHSLTINGGYDKSKYNFSVTHYNENGIFSNSGYDKTTANFRLIQKVTNTISLDAGINYAQINKKGAGTTVDDGRFNMLAQILSARPTGGLKLTDEELLTSAIDPLLLDETNLAQVNPIFQSESVTNKRRAEMWIGNVSATWQIAKNLTFKTAGTYNTTNTRNDIFYREGSKEVYRNGRSPYGQTQMGRNLRWTNYNNITWKQRINKKSIYDVMLGHEVSYSSSEYLLGQAMNFPFDHLGNNNLGLGATPSKVTTDFRDKKLLSFFVRGNYNYANRYLLTATLRADGSTVFSKKNKWGYFPSFSAAWRISEEAFMKDLKWLSNFKIRLGWGVVGNDRISNYLSLDLYQSSNYGFGNTPITVLTPKQIKNDNLKWEGASSINLGFDLGFLRNRISLTADLFIKDTKDLLLAQELAHATGFSNQYQNIGKIQNRGLELSLSSNNINTKRFSWTTKFNISFIQNELKSLESGANYKTTRSGFDYNFTQDDYIAVVGSSLGQIYGYEFDGIYQSTDFYITPENKYVLKEGVVNNTRYTDAGGLKPGVVKYKDQNNDGIITTEDRTTIGNAIPKWYGGIANTFKYQNVDFSFMFQFNYGNDIYNATRLYATQSRSGRRNMLAEVADRWSETNASNKVPSVNGYITNDVYSRFVEDGSFLRLKSVTLGYTFPQKWTQRAYISKARIYASGQNLFCLSGYSGYDPEVSTAGNNPMTPGLDWGAYPKSRVFTFGLNLQF